MATQKPKSRFYPLSLIVLMLIIASGVAAGYFALFGNDPMTEAEKTFFTVMIWTFVGGTGIFLSMLATFITQGLRKD